MKRYYIKPEIDIYNSYYEGIMNYNSNVGNFGPGDKDDDDKEGDDNWDDDWSWTND